MGTVHIFINPIEILTTMRGYLQDQNFSHVRLPIEWGEHFNASSELTKEITEVVDFAISLGRGIGNAISLWPNCGRPPVKDLKDYFLFRRKKKMTWNMPPKNANAAKVCMWWSTPIRAGWRITMMAHSILISCFGLFGMTSPCTFSLVMVIWSLKFWTSRLRQAWARRFPSFNW